MADSALSKIEWASKHINELNKLFEEKRPFSYIIETNTVTCKRATGAKKNVAVIDEATLLIADVVHNIRTALDHAYWAIVSPFTTDRDERNVQFPFSKTKARLEEAIKNRLADRVSDRFFRTICELRPHGETGGNEVLYLIEYLDGLDKHRFPAPTGNYTRLDSHIIRQQVPDFPAGIVNSGFGNSGKDVQWDFHPMACFDLGQIVPPTTCVFEKKLDVPVDIVFAVGAGADLRPVVPTLYKMTDVAKKTIHIIRAAV